MPADPPGDSTLPDLRYIRELARVFKNYDLGEIEIEAGDQRILLRRGVGEMAGPVTIAAAPAPAVVAQAAPAPAAPAPTADAGESEGTFITSPFVGTFYRSSSPETPAFVQVGATVTKGQILCIVEAMKLFNELEAEFPCVIEEILIDNAQPVEYGARLFKVRKL
ncbi:MAG: acetyl-CoA carboxylase biotin carboxyl carrier protein [Myxococcales bacterium]|nr:acetyl-CoA carboxylase biotin carboxyl carrier protein [Myxococcales bacterium]MCB9700678.1 acetyl-CoA carboxylase biotin carboxyl carrier protein [Myxococcales bacterium]